MIIVTYVCTIILTNLAFAKLGIIPLAFGLSVPAAAFLAAVPLTLRDYVQTRHGKRAAIAAVAVAAAATALFSPSLAVASACAFLLGELIDMGVFTLARKRVGFLPSMLASNAFGMVVDSVVFLSIAFGSLAFLPGQLIAKAATTLAAGAFIAATRRSK